MHARLIFLLLVSMATVMSAIGSSPANACSPALGDCDSHGTRVPAPKPSFLEYIARSRWAVGTANNCSMPRKLYSLFLAEGAITWRDGAGNLDFEKINFDSENEANTTTTNSEHRDGHNEPKGQSWTYRRSGDTSILVQPANKNAFVLYRCP